MTPGSSIIVWSRTSMPTSPSPTSERLGTPNPPATLLAGDALTRALDRCLGQLTSLVGERMQKRQPHFDWCWFHRDRQRRLNAPVRRLQNDMSLCAAVSFAHSLAADYASRTL